MEPVEPEVPENSVFHDDNFNPVVLIQLTRLYDVGLALLSVFDPDKAKLMAQAHAKGEVFSPAPAWTEDDESDTVSE
jgi:hypothetical protein